VPTPKRCKYCGFLLYQFPARIIPGKFPFSNSHLSTKHAGLPAFPWFSEAWMTIKFQLLQKTIEKNENL
jgi:hypothetical protein